MVSSPGQKVLKEYCEGKRCKYSTCDPVLGLVTRMMFREIRELKAVFRLLQSGR